MQSVSWPSSVRRFEAAIDADAVVLVHHVVAELERRQLGEREPARAAQPAAAPLVSREDLVVGEDREARAAQREARRDQPHAERGAAALAEHLGQPVALARCCRTGPPRGCRWRPVRPGGCAAARSSAAAARPAWQSTTSARRSARPRRDSATGPMPVGARARLGERLRTPRPGRNSASGVRDPRVMRARLAVAALDQAPGGRRRARRACPGRRAPRSRRPAGSRRASRASGS